MLISHLHEPFFIKFFSKLDQANAWQIDIIKLLQPGLDTA